MGGTEILHLHLTFKVSHPSLTYRFVWFFVITYYSNMAHHEVTRERDVLCFMFYVSNWLAIPSCYYAIQTITHKNRREIVFSHEFMVCECIFCRRINTEWTSHFTLSLPEN